MRLHTKNHHSHSSSAEHCEELRADRAAGPGHGEGEGAYSELTENSLQFSRMAGSEPR